MIYDSQRGLPSAAEPRRAVSREVEPCPRPRAGVPCGERLDWNTDAIGRLVPWCPVCDGGQRPSAERLRRRPVPAPPPAPRKALEAVPEPVPPRVLFAEARRCTICDAPYIARSSTQRACSTACRDRQRDALRQELRLARSQRQVCTECGKAPVRARGACKPCLEKRERRRKQKIAASQSERWRRYWIAKGAAYEAEMAAAREAKRAAR